MRKVVILASALALLGAGSAMAQNFKPSEPNSTPTSFRDRQVTAPVDRSVVTSSVGKAGFSAANGFGPSDDSNSPVPRFQLDEAERGFAPAAATPLKRTYTGYNASDAFGPS